MNPNMLRFAALPTSTREAILGKHREINTHDSWHRNVYDDFKSEMTDVGISVERMYYSGFWSQGDGACFIGSVSDWGKFLQHVDIQSSALVSHAEQHFRFSVTHQGHYYHENCTSFSVDLPLPESTGDADFVEVFGTPMEELTEAVWLVELSRHNSEALEEQFTETFKGFMRALYRRLEAEYDHLTSDEAVLESLESNDLLMDAINEQNEEEEYA